MKCAYKYLSLFLILIFSRTTFSENIFPNKSTFLGIEIIGANRDTANAIKNTSPVKVGDFISLADKDFYCEAIINKFKKEKISNIEPLCWAVLFTKKDNTSVAYLIIELDLESRLKQLVRKIPNKSSSTKLSKKLEDLHTQLEERSLILFKNKIPIIENYAKGFLDYDDIFLHNIAIQLSKLTPKYNDHLLEIIHFSKNAEERTKAAQLLSWSKHHKKNLAYALKNNLFFDPDKGVRNALARSIGCFIADVSDDTLLAKSLPVYCQLISLPSFTDRNKALSSIKSILTTHPQLSSTIGTDCKKTIMDISETSVLDNVGGYAKEILKLMGDPPYA